MPDAADATRTVIFHYQVLDALRFLQDHDELYWNVTGDEWDMPIEQVTAHIALPEGATGVRAVAYTGAYGQRARREVTIEGDAIDIESTRPLLFHEGLTAVVGFDKGFVHPPSPVEVVLAVSAQQCSIADSGVRFLRVAVVVVDARARSAAQCHCRAIRSAGQLTPGGVRDAGG